MSVMISMVLLQRSIDLPVSEIERELGSRFPELTASATGHDAGTASFRLKNAELALGNMPAPIPWSDLEGPCKTSFLWKDAAEQVAAHETHVIVTISSELNKIEEAILLTKATAAVLAACDTAIGVYWCNATLVVPKKIFVEFAEEVLPHGPPLDIWVDFRVGWQTSTTSSGFTQGMEALGHREIETQDSPEKPSDLRQRLHGLAGYLLENGPVIRDGHTFGEDARERIRVVFSDSAFAPDKRVMRLQYEVTQAKPWWKVW
jgi:hypothetical protein